MYVIMTYLLLFLFARTMFWKPPSVRITNVLSDCDKTMALNDRPLYRHDQNRKRVTCMRDTLVVLFWEFASMVRQMERNWLTRNGRCWDYRALSQPHRHIGCINCIMSVRNLQKTIPTTRGREYMYSFIQVAVSSFGHDQKTCITETKNWV